MSTSTKVSRAYPWSRREFTSASILALLSTVPITISGCGGSDASPTAPTGSSSVNGTVSENHGHVAEVTAAELMSDVEISLSITGGADHAHTVTITAAELNRIAAGTQVAIESSLEDGHTHIVTFN